jgi:Prokaryotic E2 family E
MDNESVSAESEAKDHGSREPLWKLNVQGVIIESSQPKIVVRDAIKLAGFNPDAGWIVVLKVAGEPRKEVDLNATIDLTHPGVEKLRLTPRQINNGEAAVPRRHDFALLPQDEVHLDRLDLRWETIIDGADIAIEVPASYPGAQLDMFYCHPHLALANGQAIPQVQYIESVTGIGFQRWSRHRQWDSARDNVGTHLALVEESLRREVER